MKSTATSLDEEEWIRNLIRESERDLVFVWNITAGSFGGPSTASPNFVDARESAISALVAADCKVGFGDPDSDDWRVPEEILIGAKPDATKISRLLNAQPHEYEFLVFALRR